MYAAAALAAASVAGCRAGLPPDWLYSTDVTAEAATIVATARDTTSVACRDRAGRRRTAVAQVRGELRVARVTGLAPAEAHRCRVLAGRTPGGRRLRFRTPPRDGVPFRFAVVGDTGDGSLQARGLVRVVLASAPDLLVHVGDLAYPDGAVDELAVRFFEPYRDVLERMPILPTPGNHDLETAGVHRRVFGPVAHADGAGGPRTVVDRPALLMVAMASPEIVSAPTAVAWVHAALVAPPADRWRIALLHEPLYAPPLPRFVTPGLRGVLGPLFEGAGVDLVFAGHQHLYARSEPSCAHAPAARTLHVISGGGGRHIDQPIARHPAFPVVEATTHFVRVDVTHDAIDLEAVNLYGETIDRVRVTRPAASACRAAGWTRARERAR